MRLDIRLPIGLLFGVIGALLTLFGLFARQTSPAPSMAINVNLWWGIVMLIFGVVMLLLGRRGTATARLAEESPEGAKIERMEVELGLEEKPED